MRSLVPSTRKLPSARKLRERALAVTVTAALLGALFVVSTNGCNQGAEGDRCNPDLVSKSPMYDDDECGVGLSCQQPMFCPENYCCPTTGTSTNPFCQPGCNGGAAAGCAAGVTADCDAGID